MSREEKHWESFGESNPYYGVISHKEYLGKDLDEETLAKFYKTGRAHVEDLYSLIRRLDGSPDWTPKSVLDFGCGVGRLTLPFAEGAERAVGVDISPSMLETARKRAKDAQTDIVSFQSELPKTPMEFDLVHSFIVFQHIPKKTGRQLFLDLINQVKPGGWFAIHVTDYVAPKWRAHSFIVHNIPFARRVLNFFKRRPANFPTMRSEQYSLSTLVNDVCYEAGAENIVLKLYKDPPHHHSTMIIGQRTVQPDSKMEG